MIAAFFILLVLSVLLLLGWCGLRCHETLHLLQLDSYSNMRLLKWLMSKPLERMFSWRAGALTLLLGLACFSRYRLYALVLWLLFGGTLLWLSKPPVAKKPLVYTSRAERIIAVAMLLLTIIPLLFLYAVHIETSLVKWSVIDTASALMFFAIAFSEIQLAPLAVLAANILLVPVQKAINLGYLAKAKGKLKSIKPKVIGVAGSYGKTSTKYFTATILSEKFSVLKTPQSYNTLLGVCRCINELLEPKHEVLVVEIGAYQRGDVAEKCRFVHPTVGLLTTIGPEHFERFKSMESIAATNYELIESLPKDGIAVMNDDNEHTRALADKTQNAKVVRYGLERPGNAALTAEDIRMSPEGLQFVIVSAKGERVPVKCKILGKHNVLNILGAACVAQELGLTLEEIARGIEKIEPAPHRLQLMAGANGVTIIDDSYNSNPVGASEALAALGEFSTGKKVLVTPGMVELGELEYEKNKELGKQAAGVCDYVILVGPKQTKPLQDGLRGEKFPEERLRVVQNLQEATGELSKILAAGDTVLFENDLPDLYAE